MNWTQLIETVALKTGQPKSTVKAVLDAAVDETLGAVQSGDTVSWWRLGSFSRRFRQARTQRSVSNGRKMFVGEQWLPRFRPATAYREALREVTDQSWRTPEHQSAWRLAETLVSDVGLYHKGSLPPLSDSMAEDEVDALCAQAFGPAWAQAKNTYQRRVDASIRSEHPFLALAAQRRWCQEA